MKKNYIFSLIAIIFFSYGYAKSDLRKEVNTSEISLDATLDKKTEKDNTIISLPTLSTDIKRTDNITYALSKKGDLRSFQPIALNNNFGRGDATSQRTISWQTLRDFDRNLELKESFVEIKEGDEWKTYPSTRSGNMSNTVKRKSIYTHVDINNLKAGTEYTYRVGHKYSDKKSGKIYTYYSKDYKLTTAKSIEEQKNFEFIHFADSQCPNDVEYVPFFGNAINAALSKFPETSFAIHTGDMIEINGHWKNAFDAIGDKFAERAFMPVPGNHEGSTGTKIGASAFGYDADEYRWRNTSFTYGKVLFIGLNSERKSKSELKIQSDYIRNKVNENPGKTVIVYMHRSPFGGKHYSDGDIKDLRNHLAPMLNDLKVNLVIGGHDHNHFRNHPIKNHPTKIDPKKKREFIFKQPHEMDNPSVINTKKDGTIYMSEFNNGKKTYSKYKGSNKGTHFHHFGIEGTSKITPEQSVYTHIKVEGNNLIVGSYFVTGEKLHEFTIINDDTELPKEDPKEDPKENPKEDPKEEPKTEEKEDLRSFQPISLNNNFGGGDATSQRTISWQTLRDFDRNLELKESFVEIKEGDEWKTYPSTRSGNMSNTVKRKSTYTHVDINNLNAGTEYTYRVGHKYSDKKSGKIYTYYSKDYKLTTAKSIEEQKNFEFIHFADSQCPNEKEYMPYFGNAINAALSKFPETSFAIHTGDLIEVNDHWKEAFDAIGDKFAERAFMPVPGNHEGSTGTKIGASAFGYDGDEYRWRNTTFTYGNVLFIGLNSERKRKSELKIQSDYIRNKVNENPGKTVIVYMHRSPFGGKHYSDGDIKDLRNHLAPMLNDLKVNLVIGGHDHNHFRNHPIKNHPKKIDPKKTREFIFKQPHEMDNPSVINTKKDGTIYMSEFNNGKKTYSKYKGSNKGTHFHHFGIEGTSKINPEQSVYTHIKVEGKNLTVGSYFVTGEKLHEFTIINDDVEEINKVEKDRTAEEAKDTKKVGEAEATASIEKIGLNNFNLYPNPTNDVFTVNFDSSSNDDIIISVNDLNGRLIFKQIYKNTGSFSQEISLNKVQSGVYIVTIEEGKNKEVKKVVKK